ncbi:MAG: adenylyltransferase/cytidyltransferase family protein [Bacteroidetes bacterium]|nr:adenylyltransferase/cytidyltransferase family protein [Bacteroidota bacterium]
MSSKKVFVTGCFDMMHSGHIAFLQEASSYGEVYVCIGSDENVHHLKGRYPVVAQKERKYMLESLICVKQCRINSGWGIMDFTCELAEIKPDIFVVNEDGATPEKEKLCAEHRIEYKILKRIPPENFDARSTTNLRTNCDIPYRIDLAGGWLDQPYVSKYAAGPVLTISIEPNVEFNLRSGMASSTRNKAIELWSSSIPQGDKIKLAKILFAFDNPPGTKDVSGSQDALGIVLPGLNYLFYAEEDYWPKKIESVHDELILSWLEKHLCLVSLGPRKRDYHVLDKTDITPAKALALANASQSCWSAILSRDIGIFGQAFRESFDAQEAMFPNTVNDEIKEVINKYKNIVYGWKLSGAGGGGYLILVTDKDIEGAFKIKIRRRGF